MVCAVQAGCSKDQQLTLDPNPGGGAATTDPSATTPGTADPPATDKAQPVSNPTPAADAGTDPISTGSGGTSGDLPDAGTGGSTGSSAPWAPAPPLHGDVSVADADLPTQALTLLQGTCGGCHTMDRATLTTFSQYTQAFSSACLGNTDLPNVAAVDAMFSCFQTQAGNPGAPFAPQQFGIYAAAAQLPWFQFVLDHASSISSNRASAKASFKTQVAMPRGGGTPWSQEQFDTVAEWFTRGLPQLGTLLPEDPGEACGAGLDATLVGPYLDDMKTSGWRYKNSSDTPLLMYGCGAGQTGSACLSSLQRAAETSYGSGWESMPGTQIRILRDNSATHTNYWSRSSADGRFIGSGLVDPPDPNDPDPNVGGQFVDLQTGATIPADFAYDATFFPDNAGFLVQRGGYDDGSDFGATDGGVSPDAKAIVCKQSLLNADPSKVTGTEVNQCTEIDATFGLYQQPAEATDGSDYWVVFGSYQSDNGGFTSTLRDPPAAFSSSSNVTLTPMVNTGSAFAARAATNVSTPNRGDPVLSPSGGLLVLRTKGTDTSTDAQSGYALYRVDRSGGANPTASLTSLGNICRTGGKATFSYDERWMVFHHYVTADDAVDLGFSSKDDPSFAPYLSDGASNLYLADLTTGNVQRITQLGAGQYALFPHFRSDGWIYFVVRTINNGNLHEYFAASDAALVSEAQTH